MSGKSENAARSVLYYDAASDLLNLHTNGNVIPDNDTNMMQLRNLL